MSLVQKPHHTFLLINLSRVRQVCFVPYQHDWHMRSFLHLLQLPLRVWYHVERFSGRHRVNHEKTVRPANHVISGSKVFVLTSFKKRTENLYFTDLFYVTYKRILESYESRKNIYKGVYLEEFHG